MFSLTKTGLWGIIVFLVLLKQMMMMDVSLCCWVSAQVCCFFEWILPRWFHTMAFQKICS